ncbi:MAG: diacylglycerol/polyprenol kinase family protein [Longimicrobiales bacterium]
MKQETAERAQSSDFQDLVRRTEGVQLWRRAFHAAGGVLLAIVVDALGPKSPETTTLILAGLATGGLLDFVRLNSRTANRRFFTWFSRLASPREAANIASSTWYVVGVLAVHLLLPAAYLVPAILVLALPDPAASIVGRLWGRHPLGKGTMEGSAVFLIVATLVLAPFVGLGHALWVALVVTAFEVLPLPVDDNVVIPVVAGVTLWVAGLL